jgi:hypothetical protein
VTRDSWRILEPNATGHRFWYVALLLDHIASAHSEADVVLVTTPDALHQPTWIEHLVPRSGHGTWRTQTRVQGRLNMLKDAAEAGGAVVIPDGDAWLPDLLKLRLLGRRQVSGSLLLMRPAPDSTPASRARHAFKRLLLSLLPLLQPRLQVHRLVAVKEREDDVEDPVQFAAASIDRDSWLRQHDLPTDRRWVVALGEASERKCTDLLGEAMAHDDVAAAGWSLLVLGKPNDSGIRERLSALSDKFPERVVLRPQFLTDQDFDTWIARADLVPVLHRNEGSSGVLLKSWAAGTPVLVGGAHSVVQAAEVLSLNHKKVPALTVDDVATSLATLSLEPVSVSSSQWQARVDDFARSLLGTASLPLGDPR